jgi:hypothetical protein
MQPLPVVIPIDEHFQMLAQIIVIFVFSAVDLLSLQSFHEALATRVVPGVPGPTHVGNYAVGLEQIRIFPTGVLHAPIRVVHQAGLRPTRLNRLFESGQR